MDPTLEPSEAPAPRTYVTIPVYVGGRQIAATMEAADEAEAKATFDRMRGDFMAANPDADTVWGMRSATGGYGLAANVSDEASAMAQLEPGFERQRATQAFMAESDAFDAAVAETWGAMRIEEIAQDMRSLDAMDVANATAGGIGAVAADVGKGLLTAPMQFVGGLGQGANEILDTVWEAGTALSDLAPIPMPYMQIGGDAGGVRFGMAPAGQWSETARAAGIDPNEAPDLAPVLAGRPDTVTGGVVRAIGQFTAGLGVAGKALKGWRTTSRLGSAGKALVAGAIADFSAFDQADDRFSDLIQSVPELRNPVTEWLAGDENDAALEGRLKAAIEGGIIGLGMEAVEPLAKAISAYRRLKAVEPQVRTEAQEAMVRAEARDAALVKEVNDALAPLGRPDEPLVEVVRPAAAKVDAAAARQTADVPQPQAEMSPAAAPEAAAPAPASQATDGAPQAPAPEPEPDYEPFTAPPPKLRDRFDRPPELLFPLSSQVRRLWRETSPEQALKVFPTSGLDDNYAHLREVYMADRPELALGQGDNKGVLLEFDTQGTRLEGVLNKQKPTWEFMWREDAGSEYIGRHNRGYQYQDALRAARFRLSDIPRQDRPRWNRMMDRLVKAGWRRTDEDGVVTLVRPNQAPAPQSSTPIQEPNPTQATPSATPQADPPPGPYGEMWAAITDAVRRFRDDPANAETAELVRRSYGSGAAPQAVNMDAYYARMLEEGAFDLIPDGPIKQRLQGMSVFNPESGRNETFLEAGSFLPEQVTAIREAEQFELDGQLEAEGLTRAADAVTDAPQRPQDPAQAQREGGPAGANPFKINFARIGSPDDIKSVIAQMVESAPESVDAARRGVQTWADTEAGAQAILGDQGAFQRLMDRRVGQAMNDQEITALRMLWEASAAKLREVARAAADAPTDGNLAAFRKMMATHGAITEEAMGVRAEAGRALQAFRMSGLPSTAAAQRIREMVGGANREVEIENARMLAALDDDALAQTARKTAGLTDAQRVRLIIQAAFLTSPSTHVANVTGNSMGMLFETALRAAAPAMRGGADGAIEPGEAAAMLAGQGQALMDMLRNSQRFRDFVAAADETGGKAEVAPQHIFPKMAGSANPAVRAIANVANAAIQLPGRAISGMDTMFKFALTSSSLNASAFRIAAREVREGAISQTDAVRRQRELAANPTPEMLDEAARLAEEATFSQSQEVLANPDGTFSPGTGRIMLQLRQAMERGGPAGGYISGVILPFVNTPANILSYAFRSSPVAPLMRRYQQDIAAGGARAEIAKTRMIVGSLGLWSAVGMASEGHITGGGPLDPEQRALLIRQGWQPYSIRIGDTWYAYNRLDPMGTLLSFGADLADIALNTDWEDFDSIDQWNEAAWAGVGAVAAAVTNKSMLGGMTDMFELMSDPRRYAEQVLNARLVAPIPSVVGLAERLGDPFQRETMADPRPPGPINDFFAGADSFFHNAKSRIPGLSMSQPIKRDLWGRPVMHVSGMGPAWEILSPSRASHSRAEPIDIELSRLRYYPSMPRREFTVPPELRFGPGDDGRRGLQDRPDIYNYFLQVRGGLILDRLNAMVEGKSEEGAFYASATDEDRREMIANVMTEAGKQARAEVIREFYADFSDMAARKAEAQNIPAPALEP